MATTFNGLAMQRRISHRGSEPERSQDDLEIGGVSVVEVWAARRNPDGGGVENTGARRGHD
jgi:hypothetical protein